jgi:hypothetical protein
VFVHADSQVLGDVVVFGVAKAGSGVLSVDPERGHEDGLSSVAAQAYVVLKPTYWVKVCVIMTRQ